MNARVATMVSVFVGAVIAAMTVVGVAQSMSSYDAEPVTVEQVGPVSYGSR